MRNKIEQILGQSGPYLIVVLSIIPFFLWFGFSSWSNPSSIFKSLGQITALIGTVVFCVEFILATRWTVIEYLFMGLNRAYIVHHVLGAVSFVLLLFHPMFLILSYVLISIPAAVQLILPTTANLPVFLGTSALLLMIVLLVLTFFINMEYDTWKKTHIFLGGALVLASIHAFLIGSTLDQSPMLKTYMFSIFGISLIAFVYRIYRKYIKPAVYAYIVQSVQVIPGATLLNLSPVGRSMTFLPGQFAFITFFHKGIAKESHPFSIVNAPDVHTLTFAAKSLGDYTETLKLLEPNTKVQVEGPYGRFSYTYQNSNRYVWIAGGIGVTPFLSMMLSLEKNHKLTVDFYYCVKDESEALYLDSIRERISTIHNVRFTLWTSQTMGRFGTLILQQQISDLAKCTFMVCGPPPMMNAIKSQLVASGIKKRKIISEEFALQ
jgi:predicted ferric reductase